ncbi:phosphomannomutase/phosphoglucomutase [Clostridium aminobutyricum]|uniref:Phosphomannomutase/phosphoglucomutase n=1 Tax=Clostridium aminobutyricum TaxID=33953 RepID=A0A939DB42_CLOAM|nr:phosphomannomutase/phosphoglucomutase [Clostridium aminobutyricum]MBN7774352.1 phosphomannomutase/phosphoglucomutase [Clostridium aminobutyricum]
MNRHYKMLQNGSDIRGIALTGIKGELPNLGQEDAEYLSAGFLLWLSKKTGKAPKDLTISIGFDPRLSAKYLLHGLLNGMVPYGCTIRNCGLASTPAMFMSTVFPEFRCDGAIMITASHLPFNRNGFKFFDGDGGLNKKDISQIIAYAESDEELKALGDRVGEENFSMVLGRKTYHSVPTDLMNVYCDFLKDKIKVGVNHPTLYNRPLEGLKIVVDAGNGGGGFYATKVLAPLGANISNSQFLEPDGTFPNHAPNPEDKDAMHSLCMQVLTTQSDLGLIFDTDVDRSSAVDKRGREISRNGIVAMAAALVAEDFPGTTVVTDSITSDQLTVFLEEKLGLVHNRFQRGYKNVINEAIRLNNEGIDCQLAIETSGHAALKENYFLDDGAYLATKIVIKAAKLRLEDKTLDSMIADLEEPLEAVEIRLPIVAEAFSDYGNRVLADFESWVTAESTHQGMRLVTPNYEGIRIQFDASNGDGWCLLRKSLHDPIMPLNIESNSKGGCKLIAAKLKGFLANYDQLNLAALLKMID